MRRILHEPPAPAAHRSQGRAIGRKRGARGYLEGCAVGEPGMLVCRGGNLMSGYVANAEATARVIDRDAVALNLGEFFYLRPGRRAWKVLLGVSPDLGAVRAASATSSRRFPLIVMGCSRRRGDARRDAEAG